MHIQYCTINKSDSKGTHTVQTHVVQGSSVLCLFTCNLDDDGAGKVVQGSTSCDMYQC